MREQLNCPNCGMPITSTQCEYCGTLFYDFANLDFDKPTYVRINRAGEVLTMKARVRELSFRVERVMTAHIIATTIRILF